MPGQTAVTAAVEPVAHHLARVRQATAPTGATSIGDGVELARATLAPTTGYDAKAILVFTDGLENSPKFLFEVAGSIDNRTFAIGLGTAQQVSAAALTAITNATGGYLLLSGQLLPNTDDYFRVTKYFLQILAAVTNTNIVVDPSGTVAPGMHLRLPFSLAETDLETTAILLSDVPAARLRLETPLGDVIDPAGTVALGGTHAVGTNMQFYRLELPVTVGATGAHEGMWYALVDVDPRRYKRSLEQLKRGSVERDRLQAHGVRYSFLAQALSNLRLDARLAQDSLEPGATMLLRAVLTEYGIPVERRARVRAEVARPDGTMSLVDLEEVEPGGFEASVRTTVTGVFRFRVIAEGSTLRGTPFRREQLLTGAAIVGGDRPPVREAGRAEEAERLCRLLSCLLDEAGLGELLRERGIDEDALRSWPRALLPRCDRGAGKARLAPGPRTPSDHRVGGAPAEHTQRARLSAPYGEIGLECWV